jgi:hypothetical protein
MVPLGATALVAPVTVAVKVTAPPKVAAPEAAMATVGVASETVVVVVEVTADTAL